MHSRGVRIKMASLAVVLLLALTVASILPSDRWRIPPPSSQAAIRLSDLPLAAQSAISETFGWEDRAYHARPTGRGYRAANPAHGLEAEWTAEGVAVGMDGLHWQVRLAGWGYSKAWQAVPPVAPQAAGNRVEYRRGPLTEWYVNGPLGLEQGFTLQEAPGTQPGGAPLTLALAQAGDLHARPDGAGLALVRADGTTLLRYAGLAAQDSKGRLLPAWLELEGERVLLRVDDAGAQYPLVVDPYVQQARLTAFGDAEDRFGWAVALSGDGHTALVGAYKDDVGSNADQGAAYVFTLSNGVWGLQARLTADDGAANDQFGYAVALNQDGSTAIVGAAYADILWSADNRGAAYVFVRSGGIWTKQGKLDGGQENERLGSAVALSSDGNTALVSAPYCDLSYTDQGYAYVLVRSGGSWTVQGTLTLPGTGANYAYFGLSVDLSDDGNTALVGAPGEETACVYGRSGGTWGLRATLSASDRVDGDYFGYGVALSGDGSRALVGALFDDVGGETDQGSAYAFAYNGGLWNQQGKLTASDGAAHDVFGAAVTLDGDGDTALVGAYGDDVGSNAGQGSAYVYVRDGGTWSQQARLTAVDGAANDGFGLAVALSGDGDTALVGAWKDDVGTSADQGSAGVFRRSGGTWSQQAQLTASDGAADDFFGCAVALSGDGSTALVGADHGGVESNQNQGSAYVFLRSGGTWLAQQKLIATDGAADEQFGYAVALSSDGNTALVGANSDDVGSNTDQGSVYVFLRSGGAWSQQAKLAASDGAAEDFFGTAVALSSDGNTALIGVWQDDVSGNADQGSAYVFLRSGGTWSQQAQLTAADGAAYDEFGFTLALSGDGNTALVGAWKDDVGTSYDQGSAYVFLRSGGTWNQQGKLIAADGAYYDGFSTGVALSGDGDTALVGANSADIGSKIDQGAAYVFLRSSGTWSQQAKLSATDGAGDDFDFFGTAVALSDDGDTALVGAHLADVGSNTGQGAAYVFVRIDGAWSQQGQLADLVDGARGDIFGAEVALSGDGGTALIGAYMADVGSNANQGLAYVYSLPATPVLLSPLDGAVLNDDTPTLAWRASPGAAGYLLKFNGVPIDVGNVTQYTSAALPEDTYTWTIAAYDVLGNQSPYTDPWSFTVAPVYYVYLPLILR